MNVDYLQEQLHEQTGNCETDPWSLINPLSLIN
jgi:hypothetical protein